MKRNVVLVDKNDTQIGVEEIYAAHKNPGMRHRAISVILVNSNGEMLLQKRSEHKPLWPLFWSNTCCTHPFEGELYLDCAVRRLDQELGIQISKEDLDILYRFEYQADYTADLSEHELDTVIVGKYHGPVSLIPEEVVDYSWVPINVFKKSFAYPDKNITQKELTPWFKLILQDEQFTQFVEAL